MYDVMTNRRILLIDDNTAIHEDYRKILNPVSDTSDLDAVEQSIFEDVTPEARASFDLRFASQGQEGFEAVCAAVDAGTPFAVAFVDMRMPPGWDGVETIEHIWKKDPHIQIVICTAYSEYSWQDMRQRLGSEDRMLILKKPFDIAEVYQLASALTVKWSLGAQARLKRFELEEMVAHRTAQLQSSNLQLGREIATRKEAEEQLRHDALHDRLTNLANRTLLSDRIARAMKRCQRDSTQNFALLFLDLDRFKVINDSLGHLVGDELLIEVSARLSRCVRSLDTLGRLGDDADNELARLGGDEFVILLEGLREPLCIAPIAERILEMLAMPMKLNDREIQISASIGIAMGRLDYNRPEDVLRDADTALYRAKAAGKSCYEIFDRAMHADAIARLELEHELREAIVRNELRLHFQTISSVSSGQTIAMESLVRWQHPRRGLVMPSTFIAHAEEMGLIEPIGEWVLRESCRQCRLWQQQLPQFKSLLIQVNVSAKQLSRTGFVDRVLAVLDETGLDPNSLVLEITESVMLENAEVALPQLRKLRSFGVRIDLDDFGTGYSSLSYLQRLPLDGLKIDRSFVTRLLKDPQSTAIVEALISVARTFGLRVVGEGVETEEQLNELRRMGCDEVQGYYFSRPTSPQIIEQSAKAQAA